MWVLLLLTAWAVAFAACARLCHAALTAGAAPESAPPEAGTGPDAGRRLTLYETAFLSGGPHRVADLTLVSMSRDRRLLLAHTGWATVVDPEGRDDIERSVISALGPDGQSRIPPVRAALAAADAVRALAERLAAAGLAVPDRVRTNVTAATRQVRGAALLVLVMGLLTALLADTGSDRGTVAQWFSLPLALTAGALAIARYEAHAYTRWASPAGLRRLRDDTAADTDRAAAAAAAAAAAPTGDAAPYARDAADRALLTALALRGPAVLTQPDLRAALGGTRSPLRGH
ncbi:TIGR04222 domain-containing membrane protein [Streptomyces armeniacus]|uniref:TIGR04222 domain-containing membrane protein n=1 Tax=Streptomyces armeniacus TaxID=83291 RepID=A0A345XML2_9ACTN|nr:TIGR04222 domain-containing membrane protein [Streptomyces armeniacus]AXK32878.1 TIGR04222 domain-containing membrane protein [Streptomyces armeniacus]